MKNSVELLDYMGSDKHHSLAAWASTFFELDIPLPKNHKLRVDQIVDHILSKSTKMRSMEDLLNYLANENHESPFRMSSFMFGMTTDIATHIQKLKHAVIVEAENAESHKYKELKENKYYLPEDWKGISISTENKDEYNDLINLIGAEDNWYSILDNISKVTNKLYHSSLQDISPILSKKRAKETSRYFKLYNSQLNSVNKFSFAGVMMFHKKRTVPFAQEEIKDVASQMVKCIAEIEGEPFKYSLKAFGIN